MTAIFVSYSSKDRSVVRRVVALLEEQGHEVWWDRAIEPGQRFDQSINTALDRADVVVTVWSHNSVQSDWVRWESGEALNRGCLIPVRIDDAQLPPEFLRTQLLDLRHFADEQADTDDEVGRFLRAIPKLAERSPAVVGSIQVAVAPVEDVDEQPVEQQSLAVLPFRNHSNDRDYDYFADGISEDLVHALSIWKGFPVVSYASTLSFKEEAYVLDEVAERLGVRYLVTGQLRRSGNMIRVSTELTDVVEHRQLWRERWTGELADFFELQEEISTWIATHIIPYLISEARDRAVRKRPADMNAWDLSLRAHCEWHKHSQETNLKARDLALRALEQDPTSAFAMVTLAETYYHEIFYRWTDDIFTSMTRYNEIASKAVQLDPMDANAHVQKGMSLMLQQQQQAAIDSLTRAVSLNPYSPLALSMLGQLKILLDCAEEGIEHLLDALKYSPNNEAIWGDYGALAIGYYVAGNFSESLVYAQRCVDVRPNFALAWAMAAASSVASGQSERATSYIEQMLNHNPGVSEHELMFVWLGAVPHLRKRFSTDLQAAGYELRTGKPR
jgi:TolB-like protein